MSEHTPEPWRWLPDEGQFIVGEDDAIIAEIPCTGGNPADGPLIAAAPAMKQGLVEIRNSIAFILGNIPKKLQPGMQAIMERADKALEGVPGT